MDTHKRGVKVVAVLDKSNETEKYSAATFLVHAGIQPLIDDQHAIAHNKVMVIDSATILTGSFNFTKAAEERNAENLLVVKGAPELVRAYEANIQAHAAHSHPYTRGSATASSPATPVADALGEVHGNRNSKVYRVRHARRWHTRKAIPCPTPMSLSMTILARRSTVRSLPGSGTSSTSVWCRP